MCDGTRKGQVVKTQTYQNRQADYTDSFEIEYRRDDAANYRMYVNEHPNNPHLDDPRESHFYACCSPICVTKGKEPRSMEMAEAIAHYWMVGFSTHARTGSFPDKGASVQVGH